jgi:hypothetical protein
MTLSTFKDLQVGCHWVGSGRVGIILLFSLTGSSPTQMVKGQPNPNKLIKYLLISFHIFNQINVN